MLSLKDMLQIIKEKYVHENQMQTNEQNEENP